MLHITNGDAAVDQIRAAGVSGDVLPWRDVLHEGPVPAGLSQAELRDVRARFIAESGWATYLDALADFMERDAALERMGEHEEVVLWFEHDLYDQLQLIQVLAGLADRDPSAPGAPTVSMVLVADYLGRLQPQRLAALLAERRPVSPAAFAAGRAAWRAFTSPDPRAIEGLLADDVTLAPLPFLQAALRRHLEEFPWVGHGLSRSERQALEVIAGGVGSLGEAFVAAHHGREEAVFLGDLVFAWYLERLGRGPEPLVQGEGGRPITAPRNADDAVSFWKARAILTPTGRAVLDGWRDWIAIARPTRWLGGVELRGLDTPWRWDPASARLVARDPSGRGR